MSSTTSYGAVPTTSEEDTESPRGLNSEIAPVKKKSCNDILFAILFLAHICYLIYSWFLLTPEEEDEVEVETDNQSVLNVPELDIVESVVTQEKFTDRGVLRLVGVSTGTALVLSTLAIIFMTTFSDELVHIALAAPILGAIAVGGYGIYIAKVWMMVTGGVGFLLFGILACCVMKRVDVSLTCVCVCVCYFSFFPWVVLSKRNNLSPTLLSFPRLFSLSFACALSLFLNSYPTCLFSICFLLSSFIVCLGQSSHGLDCDSNQCWIDCCRLLFGIGRLCLDRCMVWCNWFGHEWNGLVHCLFVLVVLFLDSSSH